MAYSVCSFLLGASRLDEHLKAESHLVDFMSNMCISHFRDVAQTTPIYQISLLTSLSMITHYVFEAG